MENAPGCDIVAGDIKTYGMFVEGESVNSSSGGTFTTINPATGEALAEVAQGNATDVDRAVDAARQALDTKEWGGLDPSRRGQILLRIAEMIRQESEGLARLESLDVGKTLKEARSDLGYVVRTWEYFAGLSDKVEGKTIPVPGLRLDYTLVEPMGVTAHIVPWNYPLVLGSRGIAPALAAGNTAVVKPSSWSPLTTVRLAELAHKAGLPKGVLNVVTGPGAEVGGHLTRHPGIDSITFTGSLETGREVMKAAAEHVKPVVLELGGKCPNIVLEDADKDRAIRGVMRGIFTNAGQMCWAGSRLLVQESIEEEFLGDLREKTEGIVLGPGSDENSQMGPLVSKEHMQLVLEYIGKGVDEGGTLLTGGGRVVDGALVKGNFVKPTIFADVDSAMTIAKEEIFGPVLSSITFSELDEAVEIANKTEYGLCAGIWTTNLGKAHRLASEVEAGIVSINEYPITFPQTPFGGFKRSGIGREQGLDAVYSYCRVKNVNVNLL